MRLSSRPLGMGNLASGLRQPLGQTLLDALESFWRDLAGGSQKDVFLNYRQTANPNYAGDFQPAVGKVRIIITNRFIKPRNRVTELRGNHADEPVIVCSRQFAQQESRSKFSFFQIGLGKSKQHNLACLFHSKTTFKSAVV